MAKKTKVWLMLAILFIFAGGILFTGVMMALDWDFAKLSTTEFEVTEYEVAELYENIYIDTETSDVIIIPSDVRKTTVTCLEQENMKHRVAVVNGTLEIKLEDTRAFHHHIAINFRKPQIKVYIPRGEYGDLSIKATTGDVVIQNGFSFENIDVSLTTGDIRCNAYAKKGIRLKTTTGDIRMEDVRAWNAELRLTTGNVYMLNVVLSGNVLVYGTTGNVRLDDCDARDIYIKLSTGDVFCRFLSYKAVDAHTTTGKMDYLPGVTGDPCTIRTTTGNIIISYR